MTPPTHVSRTFRLVIAHSKLHAPTTDAMKIGVGRLSFVGSLLKRPDRRCVNRRTPMFRDSIFSRMALSGIPLFRFFTTNHTQRSSGSEKVWKQTPSFPSKGRQCSDASSELVSGWCDDHEFLVLYLGRQSARAEHSQPSQEGMGITKTWNKNGYRFYEIPISNW